MEENVSYKMNKDKKNNHQIREILDGEEQKGERASDGRHSWREIPILWKEEAAQIQEVKVYNNIDPNRTT